MLGQAIARFEDETLLRGKASFMDDLNLAHQVHACFVRSPFAHAVIRDIDVAAGLAQPGVLAVFTAADLNTDGLRPMRDASSLASKDGTPILRTDKPTMATDRVRFVGDTVAMVVAISPQAAAAAAAFVEVDYEERQPVVDGPAALAPDAPQIWEHVPLNCSLEWAGGDEDAVSTAFATAATVAGVSVVNNRVVVAPLETRGALAQFDRASGRYTIYTPSQGANEIREGLTSGEGGTGLGVSLDRIRVVTPEVGGAFGMKIPVYPEQLLVAWAARKLNRPVKWMGERTDAFTTDGQARDHVMTGELALDAQGQFLAVRCRTVSNMGAYFYAAAPTIPTAGGTRCITGVYRIGAWHAAVQVVYTNTTPVVAYRGAGKPEYNYFIERLIDAAAAQTGIDPVELRRRNLVPVSAMPFKTGTGLEFDCGEFESNLEDALAAANWSDFEARRTEATARGRLRGIGLAMFQEPDGFLDNRVNLAFDVQGGLTVSLTGQSAGHGHATTFAQVASAQLGIALERVYVVQGDSDRIGSGRGTGGSRTATVAGGGIVRASAQIIDKARAIAAHEFEASLADVIFETGVLKIPGTDRQMSLDEVVSAAFNPARLPPELEPGLEATSHYLARAYNYPCGCHICEVEIDPETGMLALLRYVAVNDHGVVINPLLLGGQVHGGVVQGLGQAMTEDCVYDPETGQLLSGSFMDYCIPRATDLPDFEVVLNCVPTQTNPLGVKGVGESGCTAACPALMNAVVDALSPLGIDHVDMPVTPYRLWQVITRAKSA